MIKTGIADTALQEREMRMLRTWTVEASRPSAYSVIEVSDIFRIDSRALLYPETDSETGCTRRIAFIDNNVHALYGKRLEQYLAENTAEFKIVPISVSEANKDIDYVEHVLREIIDFGISRRGEPILAIGGGVLLDIVGFAASIYRRGTPYIRVPTTLMGIVDAGIGIKTGVNYARHKNRIGSYWPPLVVLLDKSFLRSLPPRHLLNGTAEIIKMAVVRDALLFTQLEGHGCSLIHQSFSGHGAADTVIGQAVEGMLDELHENLWEENLERLVDFGHSFSPQLEMRAVDELLHGEAVAIDMCICTEIAMRRRLISRDEGSRIISLIESLGLPCYSPHCDFSLIEECLLDCARHRNGAQRIPLPTAIGRARFFNDVTLEDALQACQELKLRSASAVAA